MRRITSFTAVLAVMLPTAVAAAESGSSTTRIETQPVYGGTVTEERGVRVFRPLPPVRHVIVAPSERVNVSVKVVEPGRRLHSDR